MPNHIRSRLTINGTASQVEEVLDFVKGKDEKGRDVLMDFNKIIPMPKSLDGLSSSMGDNGMKYLIGLSGNIVERHVYTQSEHFHRMEKLKAENPELFEKYIFEGKRYLHNITEYGCKTWYEWRCANWGTKWNAYEIWLTRSNEIEFQTAWSGVPGLMGLLAKQFPEVEFHYIYADENCGYNTGKYHFFGDVVEDLSPEDDSAEAWELVFTLGVADRDEYTQQPDGSWRWNEEDEE